MAELNNMHSFGVYHLEKRDNVSHYKRLLCRWVYAIRGVEVRCRFVGKDFKVLDPNKTGLYTVGRAATQGRIIDYYHAKNLRKGFKSLIGDEKNAFFHTPQNENVYVERTTKFADGMKPETKLSKTW